MATIKARVGSQNVVRVLSNASSPPSRLNNLFDVVADDKENKDGYILVWDSITEKYYLTNTIDATSLVATGFVTFANTQQSTSPSTGAFVVVGGAGIEKNLYVGESLNVGENVFVTGLSTFSNDVLINNELSVTGLTTVTNTTDNVLGNPDTGALQIDGGVGINKNLTVGGSFYVQGTSEFIGNATFRGGTIGIGDSTGDDIDVGGEFVSDLVPNDNNAYDLGIDGKRWRTARFATSVETNQLFVSGISSFSNTSIFTSLIDANGGIDANSLKVEDLTENRVVIVGIDGELEDDANFTFDGSQLVVGAALTVSGIATFTGTIDANGNLDVDGYTELDDLNVSGVSTFQNDTNILTNLSVGGTSIFYDSIYYAEDLYSGPNGIGFFRNDGEFISSPSTENPLTTSNYILTTDAFDEPIWTSTIDGGSY